jgi:hypothetical protein
MNRNDFLDRMDNFASYCNRFERITLFEITQYFGPDLFLVITWFLSLPLFILSNQYIIIPLSAFNIILLIWYYFGQSISIPDFIKRMTISSNKIKALITFLSDKMQRFQEKQLFSFLPFMQPLSLALCVVAQFQIGFVPTASLWPAFALLFMLPGLFFRDSYLTLLGYFCFFVQIARG